MAWNDADTVDESRRQDRLVNAEIEQASKGRWISVTFVAACFIAAALFFAFGNEVAGIAFLAAPVVTAGTQFLANVFSRSSRGSTAADPMTGSEVTPTDPAPGP